MSINISRINIEEKKFSYFSRKKNYYRQKMKMQTSWLNKKRIKTDKTQDN